MVSHQKQQIFCSTNQPHETKANWLNKRSFSPSLLLFVSSILTFSFNLYSLFLFRCSFLSVCSLFSYSPFLSFPSTSLSIYYFCYNLFSPILFSFVYLSLFVSFSYSSLSLFPFFSFSVTITSFLSSFLSF
jgi:hypothetical protein